MKDFLTSIGIELPGELTDDDRYVVTINTSNMFSKIFARLEQLPELLFVESEKEGMDFNHMQYEAEKYYIDLYSDFEADSYRLEITEKVEF